MPTVAVAGGVGSIGLNIVNAIHAVTSHNVIVLSRSDQPDLEARGITVRVVDYSSAKSIHDSLRDVETVISCLAGYGAGAIAAQLALVEAAKHAGVKRFVPSDWATDCGDVVDAYRAKEPVFEALRNSGMEHTRFVVGFWMNVWGVGALNDEPDALAGYKSVPFILNIRDGVITFPGNGDQKIVFTTMQDIGAFVAASLDLPKWDPISRIAGDRISGNELVDLVQRVTGRALKVVKVPPAEISSTLQSGDLDFGSKFYYQLLDAIAKERIDFEPTFNAAVPHIHPTTAAEYLEKYWVPARESVD
jgi:uncharacterized protein YbjT (DUF2867 family)